MYRYYTVDAHFVGHQEQLAGDLFAVMRLLHIEVDVVGLRRRSRVNVSAGANVDLASTLRHELEDAERDAFESYGFAPDDEPASDRGPTVLGLDEGLGRSLTPPFAHDTGFAWTASVPDASRFADNAGHPQRSMLQVTEDGARLAGPHAAHDDIRHLGGGRFSHWNDIVMFSTSDNTNPNQNGRRYRVTACATNPCRSTTLTATEPHGQIGAAA